MSDQIALPEHPISFKGEMVRMIIRRLKTQTRRLIKLPAWSTGDWKDFEISDDGKAMVICKKTGCLAEIKSPYGVKGDHLWVRETYSATRPSFFITRDPHPENGDKIWYKADNNRPTWAECRWMPSIHMFRRCSRILLLNEGERIQYLSEITAEDAIAEGIEHPLNYPEYWKLYGKEAYSGKSGVDHCCVSPLISYMSLWDYINDEPYDWDHNPIVRAVSFSVLEVKE